VVSYQFPPDGEPGYVGMELGRSHLGIGADAAAEPPPAGGRQFATWVYADDCDAAVRHLRDHGVPLLTEPADQPGANARPRSPTPTATASSSRHAPDRGPSAGVAPIGFSRGVDAACGMCNVPAEPRESPQRKGAAAMYGPLIAAAAIMLLIAGIVLYLHDLAEVRARKAFDRIFEENRRRR
jgi:lactoylglutathione lyase